MSQMIYTTQLKGKLSPVGTSPNVMKVRMVGRCRGLSEGELKGMHRPAEAAADEEIVYESEVTFLGGFESSEVTAAGEAGFKETGILTFGRGEHRLRFSTIGQGYIGPSAEPSLRQGAVMWQVESGEGRFTGAQGLITSNFMISDAGEITDYHTGVIFLA
jgi:hypothetical protein